MVNYYCRNFLFLALVESPSDVATLLNSMCDELMPIFW